MLDGYQCYENYESNENREIEWMTPTLRMGLSASATFVLILSVIGFSITPFVFRDTKKIEHRVINTFVFSLIILAGAGIAGAGYVISHDEPIWLMKLKRKRVLTAYEIGVGEEIEKKKIIGSVLPPLTLPQLEPATEDEYYQDDIQSETVEMNAKRIEYAGNSQPISTYKPEEISVIGTHQIDKIVYNLAQCRTSILLCSQPGTGKTTLTLAWLWALMSTKPNTEIYIIGQKRDHWLGLGGVPGVMTVVDNDVRELLEKVEIVVNILKERCQVLEADRNFQDKPIRLIFDDYTATFATLKRNGKKTLDSFVASIAYLVTVGREFNVCLYIAAHSFNLSTLGLEGKDIRDCLTLMCLGFESVTEDGKSGGFESIDTILNNQYIVKKDSREALVNEYHKLKKESIRNSKQLLLCTLGGISIRLLTDLRWVRNKSLTGELPHNEPKTVEVKPVENINLKKNEIKPIENPGGEIGKVETWLKVSFPDKLNKVPAYRPGLYAFLIDDVPVYIGQSSNLYERLNIQKHHKKEHLFKAIEKGLKVEVAYFSTNMPDEERCQWEEKLFNEYNCSWNGTSKNPIPESMEEKLLRQDESIYNYCVDRFKQYSEPVRVRDIQRDYKLLSEFKLNSDKVKKSLERLQKEGKGKIKIVQIKGTESWKFEPKL